MIDAQTLRAIRRGPLKTQQPLRSHTERDLRANLAKQRVQADRDFRAFLLSLHWYPVPGGDVTSSPEEAERQARRAARTAESEFRRDRMRTLAAKAKAGREAWMERNRSRHYPDRSTLAEILEADARQRAFEERRAEDLAWWKSQGLTDEELADL
jgi:hypothetical protein